MEIGIRRLRFINLVGVIQLKTVRIEILPKLDFHQEDNRQNRSSLLTMLSVTKQLPVQLNDQTLSEYEKMDLSIFLLIYIFQSYISCKACDVSRISYKNREFEAFNRKIADVSAFRHNAHNPVNAFCEYDELSLNVLFNQVLKAALKIIQPFVQQLGLKTQVLIIYEMFDEVDDIMVDMTKIESISFTRQNQDYEGVYNLAIAIINSTGMSTGFNQQIAYSFLFQMNDCYEGYTGECLKSC